MRRLLLGLGCCFLFSFSAHAVTHVVDGALPNGGDCATMGAWNAATKTCAVESFTLNNLDRLEIYSATLHVTGLLTNHATIQNHSRIHVSGELFSTSFILNEDYGHIINDGLFTSTVLVYNFGYFHNTPTGSMDVTFEYSNNGTTLNEGTITSGGSFINNGYLDNRAPFEVRPGSEIFSFGTIANLSVIENDGTVRNRGTLIDQCTGQVSGNEVEDNPSVPGKTLDITPSQVAWCGVPTATSYDLLRGDLASLLQTGGDFSTAAMACVANDTSALSLAQPGTPTAGNGYWYLVRANGAGNSYDSEFESQIVSRDLAINSSTSACEP